MSDRGYLLDTHVLLWWLSDGSRLSPAALDAIAEGPVAVSAVSCWETAILVAKKRIELDRPTSVWVADLLSSPGIEECPLSARIAVRAGELDGFHGDPADRMLAATAIETGRRLVTKDERIREWAEPGRGLTCIW